MIATFSKNDTPQEHPATRIEGRTAGESASGRRRSLRAWPVFMFAGLLTASVVGFVSPRTLFDSIRSDSPGPGEQITAEPVARGSSGVDMLSDNGEQVTDGQLQQGNSLGLNQPKAMASFNFQSKAEAAQSRSVQEVTPVNMAGDESCFESGNEALYEQVKNILSTASLAVKSENLEAFLSLLDDSELRFFREQKAKAKLLFRRFDQITGTYSDVKIEVLNDSELAVRLHCKLEGASASSGRPVVVFNGDQAFTLKKAAGTAWKICAIDRGDIRK